MANKLNNRPRVGIASIVFQGDKVLLGKRLSELGYGLWAFPGGHLEAFETPFECAKRETFEETGLSIQNLHLGPYVNTFFTSENKHYITGFVISEFKSGALEVKELDKCETWEWFNLSQLPEPLFPTILDLLNTTTLASLRTPLLKPARIAYLAAPYAHKDPVIKARRLEIVTKVASVLHTKYNYVFSPLTHNAPLSYHGTPSTWDQWGPFDLSMLSRLDALYVLKLDGFETSKGVQQEIKTAKDLGLPIYFIEADDLKKPCISFDRLKKPCLSSE